MIITIAAVIIGVSLNLLRDDSLPLLHQKLQIAEELPVPVPEAEPVLIGIDLAQATEMFKAGLVFIDAREREYFIEGHIPGAWNINLPLELAFKLDSLQGKDAAVITYCGEENCGDSEDLAYTLRDLGFTRIFVYKGGWLDWVEAGMPVEK